MVIMISISGQCAQMHVCYNLHVKRHCLMVEVGGGAGGRGCRWKVVEVVVGVIVLAYPLINEGSTLPSSLVSKIKR